LYTSPNYLGDQVKENEMGGVQPTARVRESRAVQQMSFQTLSGRRNKLKCADIVKVSLTEKEYHM